MRTLISQLTSQELGRVVGNCRHLWYNARFKSRALNHFLWNFRIVRNVFGHLRTSSEVFGKRRICSCRLRKSWYSPVKNLTISEARSGFHPLPVAERPQEDDFGDFQSGKESDSGSLDAASITNTKQQQLPQATGQRLGIF